MKSRCFKSALILSVLMAVTSASWAQRGPGRGLRRANAGGVCLGLMNTTPTQTLDANEASGLLYMREEEKLAHDVYATLHSKWGLRIFGNISQSEERHVDALKLLLNRYELADPAANNPLGVFQNQGLQTLYNDLVRQGEGSLSAALKVGATVEDLDIHDLEKAASATTNEELKLIYGNLQRASENHLQAFIGQLGASGGTYSAQYISSAALSAILAQPQQTGMGFRGRGNGQRGIGRGYNGICPWRKP
jgi:hypothetical protein